MYGLPTNGWEIYPQTDVVIMRLPDTNEVVNLPIMIYCNKVQSEMQSKNQVWDESQFGDISADPTTANWKIV